MSGLYDDGLFGVYGYYRSTKRQILSQHHHEQSAKVSPRWYDHSGVVQLGSTVSTRDIRLDRRHIVGLLLRVLFQPHHVSLLGGLRPL